jgi:hypothetical protein
MAMMPDTAHVLRQGCGSRRASALVPCLLAPRDRRSAVDRTSGRILQAASPNSSLTFSLATKPRRLRRLVYADVLRQARDLVLHKQLAALQFADL